MHVSYWNKSSLVQLTVQSQVINWISTEWLLFVPFSKIWIQIQKFSLTHWGRVTHIYVGKLTIIGSDNGLWPGRRQAIIWTNAGILLIGPLGTNFSEILIEIQISSLKKIWLKMSEKCLFHLGLNVLKKYNWIDVIHIMSTILFRFECVN